MPYAHEHSATLVDPNTEHLRVRRTKGSGTSSVHGVKIPDTIGVVWHVIATDCGEVPNAQELRFPVDAWTSEKAKAWLDESELDAKFVPAQKADDAEQGAVRFDAGTIGTVSRTDEGYLNADAAVSRTGVFTYYNPDGTIRRELRHPDDIFRNDSITTLRMKPVTNGHPPVRLLNASTAKKFQVGNTGENVRRADRFLMSTLVVTDEAAIKDVETGKKELSCGYTCDLVQEKGEFDGERYDHRQTNIRYNHVALCTSGRAGPDVRINLDNLEGIDAFQTDDASFRTDGVLHSHKPRSRFMARITLDGIDYEADQQVLNHLTRTVSERDTAKAKLDAKQAELDTATAERDTLKAKNDELDKAVKDTSHIDSAVKARIALERVAGEFLDKETVEKLDSMTDADIRKAIILKRFPEAKAKLDDATCSDVYITARFDAAVEVLKAEKNDSGNQQRNDTGMSAQRRAANGTGVQRGDANDTDPDVARKRMIDSATVAYKNEKK